MIDPRAIGVAARVGLDLQHADPLRFRRLSSPALRTLIEHVARGTEGYGHAGNAAGKTEGIADLFVRMCRGQERMDGRLLVRPGEEPDALALDPYEIALPGLQNGEAWRHWVLVQSYAQAKDSSMRAYRKLLGRHPHKIGWLQRDQGTVKLIKIKPDVPGWSDDPETWSEITFISQEGMTDEDVRYVQGARVHSVHGDEMPKQNVWREVRARGLANQKLYLCITATPEFKHEWEWCYNDFLGCLGSPVKGRIRLQWSVEDNRALSLADIAERRHRYEGDELFKARWAGEHVDSTGANPFQKHRAKLDAMLVGCQRGRIETVEVRGEPAAEWEPDYRDILPSRVEIERWLPYDPTHSYLITVDPSRGIDDEKHDPCELQVWDWTEPALVCRYGMRSGEGGYLDEDSLAILADTLGRQYGKALVDVEVGGGYGQQFVLTLRKRRYPNLAHDDRSDKAGVMREQYGWTPTASANGEIVNAIIKGLAEDTFLCFSGDVLRQWADVREDSQGRPAHVAKGARHHREAMICAGRALHWIHSKPAPRVLAERAVIGVPAILEREFGRPVMPRRPRANERKRPEVFRAQ